MLREQASPGRLGAAVGLGVLVACSPFYGFQMLLAVGLASLFRLNRLAALIGSQLSTPPLSPLLLLAAAQAGELVLRGRFLPLSLEAVRAIPWRELVVTLGTDLLVGGLLVGSVLGLALGAATASLVRRHRARSPRGPTLSEAELDALEDRLDALPRRFRSYGTWKARLDPAYPMALKELSEARALVDLGAGMGLFAALACERFPGLTVRAIEWDERKAALARAVCADLPQVKIEAADARTAELGHPDAVVLLDVLHYSDPAAQRGWLDRCAEALSPGGVMLVRELNGADGKTSAAERLEGAAVGLGWIRGEGVRRWPAQEIAGALRARGWNVTVTPAGRWPFAANALVVARKPLDEAAKEVGT